MKVLSAEEFLTPAEQQQVRQAVAAAEQRTSGEIRVHLDDTIVDEVLDHAAFVFTELDMQKTKDRNGVLIYVCVPQRRIAVIGDKGIDDKLPKGYWNEVVSIMVEQFKVEQYCTGLCMGVQRLGEQLRAHFPYERSDTNELSDDISYGKK